MGSSVCPLVYLCPDMIFWKCVLVKTSCGPPLPVQLVPPSTGFMLLFHALSHPLPEPSPPPPPIPPPQVPGSEHLTAGQSPGTRVCWARVPLRLVSAWAPLPLGASRGARCHPAESSPSCTVASQGPTPRAGGTRQVAMTSAAPSGTSTQATVLSGQTHTRMFPVPATAAAVPGRSHCALRNLAGVAKPRAWGTPHPKQFLG